MPGQGQTGGAELERGQLQVRRRVSHVEAPSMHSRVSAVASCKRRRGWQQARRRRARWRRGPTRTEHSRVGLGGERQRQPPARVTVPARHTHSRAAPTCGRLTDCFGSAESSEPEERDRGRSGTKGEGRTRDDGQQQTTRCHILSLPSERFPAISEVLTRPNRRFVEFVSPECSRSARPRLAPPASTASSSSCPSSCCPWSGWPPSLAALRLLLLLPVGIRRPKSSRTR